MFWQTAGEGELRGVVGVGACRREAKGTLRNTHLSWALQKLHNRSKCACEAAWRRKKNNLAKEITWIWGLSGAQVALQPLSRQRPVSAGMCNLHLSWVCPGPQPPRTWVPGGTSETTVVCRFLWSHNHGDFQKWSAWWSQPEVPLGTSTPGISELDGKKLEEVSDWLFILSRQQAQGAVLSGECCSGRL